LHGRCNVRGEEKIKKGIGFAPPLQHCHVSPHQEDLGVMIPQHRERGFLATKRSRLKGVGASHTLARVLHVPTTFIFLIIFYIYSSTKFTLNQLVYNEKTVVIKPGQPRTWWLDRSGFNKRPVVATTRPNPGNPAGQPRWTRTRPRFFFSNVGF